MLGTLTTVGTIPALDEATAPVASRQKRNCSVIRSVPRTARVLEPLLHTPWACAEGGGSERR